MPMPLKIMQSSRSKKYFPLLQSHSLPAAPNEGDRPTEFAFNEGTETLCK